VLGRTHISIALGHAADDAGYCVFYTTAADLAARCDRGPIQGRWDTVMRLHPQPKLLVIDELGYLALPTAGRGGLIETKESPLFPEGTSGRSETTER
jgi:DNA replication protein DnaC